MEMYMQLVQITYMAPIDSEPTHTETAIVIARKPGQLSRFSDLFRGREINVSILATSERDLLPMVLDLDAIEAEKAQRSADQTDPGNDEAAPVH